MVATEDHLHAAAAEGDDRRELRRLRGLVDEHPGEVVPLQEARARAHCRATNNLGVPGDLDDLLAVGLPIPPLLGHVPRRGVAKLRPGDLVDAMPEELGPRRLGAPEAHNLDALRREALHQVVHRDVGVRGREDAVLRLVLPARIGVGPGPQDPHGASRLARARGALHQGDAAACGRIQGPLLALVHARQHVGLGVETPNLGVNFRFARLPRQQDVDDLLAGAVRAREALAAPFPALGDVVLRGGGQVDRSERAGELDPVGQLVDAEEGSPLGEQPLRVLGHDGPHHQGPRHDDLALHEGRRLVRVPTCALDLRGLAAVLARLTRRAWPTLRRVLAAGESLGGVLAAER
mmetsp:Transcript_24305/g.69279  ORF Transcript_24305/g.69279 Transcript_24305/m.69279 type:complete len:349 (-) Transcript_24305:445-1491(-)